MISFWWATVIFIAGGTIGFFLAGLCYAASRADREDEERWRNSL